jgi:hypothetical protein
MDSDDRPRKKKKKKSNTGLWIGLGIGGGVLLILVVVLVVVMAVSAMSNREPDDQAKAKLQAMLAAQQPAQLPPPVQPAKQNFDKIQIGEKKRDGTNIRLRAERPARLNELAQIKLFYLQYGDGSKPPPSVDAFVKSLGPDGQAIKQAIDEKYYVILPNVRSGVIAYERDPDTNNLHGFIDTMGGAREMSTQELFATLKSQGN